MEQWHIGCPQKFSRIFLLPMTKKVPASISPQIPLGYGVFENGSKKKIRELTLGVTGVGSENLKFSKSLKKILEFENFFFVKWKGHRFPYDTPNMTFVTFHNFEQWPFSEKKIEKFEKWRNFFFAPNLAPGARRAKICYHKV